MKPKLKRFNAFADGLFPSELAYVLENNDFQDPDYASIMDVMKRRIGDEKGAAFDASVDPRKYTRLMRAFERKLEANDVDAYYAWISKINYLINTDAIDADEQARILRETQAYNSSWYHAGSFYRAMSTYEAYLLIRYRERDLNVIQEFLVEYASGHARNEQALADVKAITEHIVKMENGNGAPPGDSDLQQLLSYFSDEGLSKKARYHAWLAYHMYHLNTKQFDKMVEPLRELEAKILSGDFYSRRILANFYANKLLLLSHLGQYEEAAFCGLQSIKHRTEDYLYYINNYCSVLMHLERYEAAAIHMKASLTLYRDTRDKNRKLVFASNYCRCLNALNQHRQSIRLASKELEELRHQVFKFRWHYFFRVYFAALLAMGQSELLLRLSRTYKIEEREQKSGRPPFLRVLIATAAYHEMRISEKAYRAVLRQARTETNPEYRRELNSLIEKVEVTAA